jgi:hypothetical protein
MGKRNELIPSLGDILDILQTKANFYLESNLKELLLARVDED